MATVCVDPDCKTYLRGEVIPVSVEVLSNSESEFRVVGSERTYCEVRTSSGEIVTTLSPRIQEVEEYHKQLFCSWDTNGLEAGYYNLRFWISINISDAQVGGEYVEDYRLASTQLKRYIKAE